MEEQIEINEVLKYLREQIADQAQQIAILKATLAMKETPTT
jgi:restriction endonuclease S subunit